MKRVVLLKFTVSELAFDIGCFFITSEDMVYNNEVYVSKILAPSKEFPKYQTKRSKKRKQRNSVWKSHSDYT